jgi:two-component system, chemotaxis family, CheB/CheR fusion protein
MSQDAPGEPRDHTPPDQLEAPPADEPGAESPFPIVGIGASAGGLEAFTQLLAHLPARTGMAFVLVQHLDPHHESRLTELLARATQMPVIEASQGLRVAPDHIYIIPPNATMALARGALQVTPRGEAPGPHLPVDHFLRALAHARQTQAIGVVFSGTGSDGTLGLLEVKAVGGITFAQEPGSARHGGMPQSAIGSGAVDFVLSPRGIAERLAEIGTHPYLSPGPVEPPVPESEDHFSRVLGAVKAATEVDFTHYRDTTIRRRILRRMALHGESSLAAYARRLEQDGAEVEALYRDILINVTSFFRDPALFEALKTRVFPEILKAKPPDAPLRLWVPGCSTGQEAYSLAIALWEFFDGRPRRHPFQIFGTDLSDPGSLERARAGLYPESIKAEVASERLRRFFKKEDHLYRIDKSIRERCVFARQNLTADPPFSHVDLISCRNVLIYMNPALQRRLLPIFHYALNVPGFLVLGASETVGEFNELFQVMDRANKVFAKQITASRPPRQFVIERYQAPDAARPRAGAMGSTPADFHKEADRLLLSHYAPPGVLVNEQLDILQFRGHTGRYLEAPPGEPSMNLLKMARPGLFVELRSAVNEALIRGETVRREGLCLRDEQGVREVAIEVLPVRPREAAAQCCLVLFEEDGASQATTGPARPPGWRARLYRWFHPGYHPAGDMAAPARRDGLTEPGGESAQLRQELSSTREYLQSLVEQQDAANEELRSANEEALSANEELQSTNQELETAKEELQSINEELSTINEQLQHRNRELGQTSNDLQNLLASAIIPMIMVGPDLTIRRLTPPARKIMNLLPADLGRPIGHLKANVDVPDLEALIADVIEEMQPRQREVHDREGRRYELRVHPYRTDDNKIDGAVLLLLDIEDLKRSQEEASEARDFAQAIVATVREPLIILDGELRVVTANAAFYRTFGVQSAETQARLIYDLGNQQWDIPALRKLLERVLTHEQPFEGFELQHSFPEIGQKTMRLNARGLYRADRPSLILLAIEDVTGSKEAEKLNYQATHDALTGLVNRAELERRLERVLTGADIRDPHALLYLDLDQFKLVNDTCGHMAGDALLRQLPAVLERPLRKRDTLARLGGDEFGVLLEHCPEEHALRIAQDLVQVIQEFPFAWEDKRFTVGASIGLVAIPAGGDTLAEIMSAADRACYAAKDKGRNRVHVYAASDEELRQRRGEMQWIPRLHRALAEDRFRLYAQPVVALKDHGLKVEYSEVLLRLADEQGGLLLPGVFIPAAERYQQMRAVDRWVVRTALSSLASRDASVRYGINVSAQSLCDARFLDFVVGQLDAAGVPPGQICFEITETAAITDLKHALKFMGALKERGCRFALDDFGSGFASFGYLKTLPVDYLKIDGHFVQDLPADPFDDAVVQAIQRIAVALGLRTIAESVESEAILERVKAIGIDFAQGYTLAVPKPLEPSATPPQPPLVKRGTWSSPSPV